MPGLKMTRKNSGPTCSGMIQAHMTEQQISEAISCKASQIYEKSGRKTGRDLDNWLEAERFVRSQLSRRK